MFRNSKYDILNNMNTNKILSNILIGAIFLIAFIPLIITSSMYFPFITGKNFTFRILAEIIIGLWAILAIRDAKYRPKSSFIGWSVLAFVAIIAVADVFGVSPYKSFWSNYERMEGLVTMLHLLGLFFVSAVVLKTEKLWSRFFHTSIGVSIFLGLYGLLQLSGGIAINQGSDRVDTTLGNATYLAIYMLFLSFITAFVFLRKRKFAENIGGIVYSSVIGLGLFIFYSFYSYVGRANDIAATYGGKVPDDKKVSFFLGQSGEHYHSYIFLASILVFGLLIYFYSKRELLKDKTKNFIISFSYSAIIILQLTMLYFTASRGPILGFVGGAILASILIAIFERERPMVRKIAITSLGVLLLLVGAFMMFRGSDFVKNSLVLRRFADITISEKTTRSRFMVWNMAYQGFKEKPILGWGQENFNYVFNKYYNPKMYDQEQWFDRTHNVFLDWLIAGGILGIISYLLMFFAVIFSLWKRSSANFSVIEKSIFTGMLFGYFFQNLLVFDNITSYILFFFVMAYVHSRKTSDADSTLFAREYKVNPNLANLILVPTVIVFVLLSAYFINGRGYFASKNLIYAMTPNSKGATQNLEYFKKALSYHSFGDSEIREQLIQATVRIGVNQSASEATKRAFFDLAHAEMKKQIERTPNDARYRLFNGSMLTSFKKYEEGFAEIKKASELSPNKQSILFELVGNLINSQKVEASIEFAKKAFELAPSSNQSRVIYAVAVIYGRNNKLADELLAPILISNPELIDERVLIAYNFTAYTYYTEGKIEAAISELREVTKVTPGNKAEVESMIKKIREGKNPWVGAK